MSEAVVENGGHPVPERHHRATPQRAAAWVLLALPPLLAASYIFRFGINVPVWDQWQFAALLESASAGTLHFSDLYAQSNEHRLLFPKLVMLGLARLSSWDTRAEMWFGWAMLLATAATLLFEHLRHFGVTSRALWLFVPTAWLVFTLRQSENFLWGFQLQIFLAGACLVLALTCLESGRTGALLAAIAAGAVCSYSFASGLAVWPAGLVVLVLAPGLPSRRWRLATWALAGLLVVASYLHGYRTPSHHPPPGLFLGHLAKSGYFFLAMVGGSLVPENHPRVAALLGVVLLLLLVLVMVAAFRNSTRPPDLAFGLALVSFSLGATLLTAVGRVGFNEGVDGIGYALLSRYTTFTVLGICGIYRCALALPPSSLRTASVGILAAMMLAGTASGIRSGYLSGRGFRQHRLNLAATLLRYRSLTDDEARGLFIDVTLVRHEAAFLDRSRLTLFRTQAAK